MPSRERNGRGARRRPWQLARAVLLAAARIEAEGGGGPAPIAPNSWFLKDLGFHLGRVRTVTWSPHSDQVVSGGDDRSVKLWDASGSDGSLWGLARDLGSHQDYVTSVAWSPDGGRIVSSGADRRLAFWNATAVGVAGGADSGPALGQLRQHDGLWMSSVAWSPDSREVVSGSWDNQVLVWTVAGSVPPSRWAVREDLGRHPCSEDNHVSVVAWSPDGAKVISGGCDHALYLWQVSGPRAVQWSPARELGRHGSSVSCLSWSLDGDRLLSGGWDNLIKLWHVGGADADGWRLLASFEGHDAGVQSVAFAPGGRQAVSGGWDHQLKLWHVGGDDIAGWGLLGILGEHAGAVYAVAWSPDGRRVASGGDDRAVKLWRVETDGWSSTGRLAADVQGWEAMVADLEREEQSHTEQISSLRREAARHGGHGSGADADAEQAEQAAARQAAEEAIQISNLTGSLEARDAEIRTLRRSVSILAGVVVTWCSFAWCCTLRQACKRRSAQRRAATAGDSSDLDETLMES